MGGEEATNEISSLQSRPGVSAAAQCEGGAGRESPVFLRTPGGRGVGPERVRGRLRGRRARRVRAGAAAESLVVRLRAAGDLLAAAGAAGEGRPGVPLSGGRGAAGPLDAERLPDAAPAGDQRSVSAGGGSGAGG